MQNLQLNSKGQAAVEYMLVMGALVLFFAAAFYHLHSHKQNLGEAYVSWSHNLAERVARP